VPARAAEDRLELLNYAAVAADRTVEPLEVAIDDEDQVVKPFAAGQSDRPERLRLVGFAIPQERPHFGVRGLLQSPVFKVAVKARLVDGHDGAQARRDGGKLQTTRHRTRRS